MGEVGGPTWVFGRSWEDHLGGLRGVGSPIQRARKGREDYSAARKVLGGSPGGLGGVGRPTGRSGSLTLMSGRGWEDLYRPF